MGAAGASLGAVALATGAYAADLDARSAYKAPPPAMPWNWTGFYLGGTIGGVRSSSENANNTFFPSTPYVTGLNSAGVIGGVEAGYNYQIGRAVLGIEGDVSWSSLNGTTAAAPDPVAQTYSSRPNALGTVRGRLGWAFDRLLVFGTGGAAFADLHEQFVWANNLTASPGAEVTGWTVGGGLEYAFGDHWTAKAEYLHVGFPDRTVTTSGIPYTFAFKDAFDIGRVGINYRF